MISLYQKNEVDFKHNGRVLKDTLSSYVIEEANSLYELELEHPIDLGISEEMIIKAPTPKGRQLFRIYRVVKNLRTIKVYARHISYDLLNNFIEDSRPTGQSGVSAINIILNAAETPHNFTGYSDITTSNTAYIIRRNVIQALIGNEENSFVSRWGGHLVRDNFEIKMLEDGGVDRGYEVRLGKNLIGIEEDLDISGIVTKLYPTVVLGDNQVYNLPEKYIESPLIDSYPNPIIREVRIDLDEAQREMDIEELYPLMRQHCLDLFEVSNIDKPKANYKVDFVELSKTEQYRHLAILEQIDIYDTVAVIVDTLNIRVKAKVIKTIYDSLRDRYQQIELGNFTNKLSNQRQQITETVNKAIKEMEDTVLAGKIRSVTERITGNLGGYVVTRLNAYNKPYEILIMDTEDINTAQDVIRINKEGIGWSTNGYNGPFDVAISAKDGIIADYIVSGILNANLIRAGTIQSQDGSTWWNLENNSFNLGDAITYSKENGLKINLSGKSLEEKFQELEDEMIYKSNEEPSSPFEGQLWLNTSAIPHEFFIYQDGEWIYVGTDLENVYEAIGNIDDNLAGFIANYDKDFTSIDERINVNSSDITQLSTEISTKVSQTEYDSDYNEINQSMTEQKQDFESFKNTIQIGGGDNLIKNSVGYGGMNYWKLVNGEIKSTNSNTWILEGVAKYGWILSNGEMYQIIDLVPNKDYTLSGKYLKSTPAGSLKIELYNTESEELIEIVVDESEEFNGEFTHSFNIGDIRQIALNVKVENASEVNPIAITDLMLAQGENYAYWTQAMGESYTLYVRKDGHGITVYSEDGQGKTVMSPNEFAGYYNDRKIFTLNGDITEVMGLMIKEKGLYIPPIKMVQNQSEPSLDIVWTGVM